MPHAASAAAATPDALRIDKWLWAARFFKTRPLAVQELDRGRVHINGQPAKPSREVRAGDTVTLRQGPITREVRVLRISAVRRPAGEAQQLYAETPASIAARELAAAQRRLSPEPAHAIAHGRPTKRDRRALDASRAAPAEWDGRWSASLHGSAP